MATIITASFGLANATSLAHGASVVSRDGKTYLGTVVFQANNQLAITPASGAAVTLPFTDVAKMWMADAPDAAMPPATTEPAMLPPPWRHGDIGTVKSAGDANEKDGTFALHGAGWGIWGAVDSCHLVYQPISGDCDFIARLVDLPTLDTPFLAGLTIRQDLDPTADEVSVMMHPRGVPRMNARPTHGPGKAVESAAQNACHWLRLIRAGDVFCGLYSVDGRTWLPITTQKVKMSGPVYAALACAATANQDLAAAAFDHVAVRVAPIGPARGLALTDGTLLAAQVHTFDAKSIHYTDSAGAASAIPIDTVAYLFNQPMPLDMRGKMLAGKPGISLTSGDSMEADVKGMNYGQVSIVSLLLGAQNIDFAQIVTVVFRPVAAQGSYSLYTNDGSIYRCKAVTVADGLITAQTPLLGTINLKPADLLGVTVDVPQP